MWTRRTPGKHFSRGLQFFGMAMERICARALQRFRNPRVMAFAVGFVAVGCVRFNLNVCKFGNSARQRASSWRTFSAE
ncbi:hypothetical protein M413DRAFT_341678 [Hebeloma cylindrosporum]|uniref:Uncharacterized protein n=1 Tax=Hebeloma cylindrosporum TaxID=76867 RepID=A0A0C3CNT1_HEBCY|nr:hypothetical protein M413DRAFT_341678 [Hebeloma cylindrosporum h7]